MGGVRGPADVRFWRHVEIPEEPGSCWTWTASRNALGYGQFGVTPKDIRLAHRFAWELEKGPIPNGMTVMHICDNPPCVKVSHLALGTQADNLADMRAKGRHPGPPRRCGEANAAARLTYEQVQAIRADTRPQRIAARAYGVGKSTIGRVRRGTHWRNLDA